ncbi:hypothetical protein M3Y95_00164600 [Aphelenchoides besseyi]|nr:hypothetical protein M3Y95_00164600 [Aphelenchoides besseyi]
MVYEADERRIVNNKEERTDWRSIYVATGLSFVGAVQFSLYFSSLWPYLKITDPGITEGFFGVTVALYSMGQVLSAPAFGLWSNRIRQVRQPLNVGLCLMMIGNGVYILMEPITFIKNRYILLVSRFLLGMGSGNVALLRTYASTASLESDRSRAIAFVTCGQAVGQVAGPAFQFIFTHFTYPGNGLLGLIHFNLYTLPAYFAILMNVVAIFALHRLFDEKYVGIIEEDEHQTDEAAESQRPSTPTILIPYDLLAVLICYATRFVDMFARSTLETLGSPFAMMMFGFTEQQAVRYVAFAQGTVGALTLSVYLLYIFGNVEKYVHYRIGTILSLALMILFHLITYAWPFLPHYVDKFTENVVSKNASSTMAVGCNATKFEWCNDLTSVNVYVYFTSYILCIGIGFPLLTITLTSLFSKILGPRRQGAQQGIFQSSSALARIVGPLIVTQTYSHSGPRPVWLIEIGVISFVLASWGVCYTRMVPLKMPSIQQEEVDTHGQTFGYSNPQFDEEDEVEELR